MDALTFLILQIVITAILFAVLFWVLGFVYERDRFGPAPSKVQKVLAFASILLVIPIVILVRLQYLENQLAKTPMSFFSDLIVIELIPSIIVLAYWWRRINKKRRERGPISKWDLRGIKK